MRIYLDTNILVFLSTGQIDELCDDVTALINDYGNTLFTSTVCLQEFIHLVRINKVRGIKVEKVLPWMADMGIRVAAPTENDFQVFCELPFVGDHRDPNDRMIIAQAIGDRVTLVSSDRMFAHYKPYGLDFIFNER